MAIFSILDKQVDKRKNGDDCEFNGYLEDYLGSDLCCADQKVVDILSEIQKTNPDAKICVGLKTAVNKDAISNQIIRYKDVFKLQGKPVIYPFIVYEAKENDERALLIYPFVTSRSYLYAKGLYYCMTEPGGLFVEAKNEIVAISTDSVQTAVDTYNKLFTLRAGAIQRNIDRENFNNYDKLKEDAIEESKHLKDSAPEVLKPLEDKTSAIYGYVMKWFLLKKILYVQFMVNKDILNQVFEGNIKKQRNQAKLNSDEIHFMSYSELWRCTGENQPKSNTEKTV